MRSVSIRPTTTGVPHPWSASSAAQHVLGQPRQDKSVHAYPAWFQRARAAFNQTFRTFLEDTFRGHALRQPVLDATTLARRIRPSLYYALWHDERQSYPTGKDQMPPIAIELFHSASIVVDDIVDGELQRRNKTPLFRSHGIDTAILVSHELVASAYQCMQAHPHAQRLVKAATQSYRQAITGEAHDLGISAGAPALTQYRRALPKTSSIFALIGHTLNVTLPRHDKMLPSTLRRVGDAFQLSNDTIDLLYFAESRRHDPDTVYPLRPSYLVGTMLHAGMLKESEIGRRLTYSRHCELSTSARQLVGDPQSFLRTHFHSAFERIAKLTCPGAVRTLSDFLEHATRPSFWLHNHE